MRQSRTNDIVIVAADDLDWLTFMVLAQQEGWRVPESELQLHVATGLSQSWALRKGGATIGLVTGLRHRQSAWIGNLIVDPRERGKGYGVTLFEHAMQELRSCGAETLWLTASPAGAPIYAARGFTTVGRIERWLRSSGGGNGELPAPEAEEEKRALAIDREIWGDERAPLLHHLGKEGIWLQSGESRALLQRGHDLQIIGPWYGSPAPGEDKDLLKRLVAAAQTAHELVIDLVTGSGREEILAAAGFNPVSTTGLMVAGPAEVDWTRLVALATLGSCG